jgi:hypothetical protein
MDRTIRSLNDKEYIQLLDAMKKQEGWREGREEYNEGKKGKMGLGNPSIFIKAKGGPPNYGDSKKTFTVHYFDKHGNMFIRSGGSTAWRCNNPGALLKSYHNMDKGLRPIGSAGYDDHLFSVYPDYETGHEALIAVLQGIWSLLPGNILIPNYATACCANSLGPQCTPIRQDK